MHVQTFLIVEKLEFIKKIEKMSVKKLFIKFLDKEKYEKVRKTNQI